MTQSLRGSAIDLVVRLELRGERDHLGHRLLVVRLDGNRTIVTPHMVSQTQRFGAEQTLHPDWFGEQFERSVDQVVVDLALEAVAKPMAAEMKDLFTEAIVARWWR